MFSRSAQQQPGSQRLGLAAILMGITASVLMQTMLATAMPQVALEFGDEHLYGWVFASYLLASTVPMPLFAQLADLHGRRPLFLLGMSGYAVGTAMVALSGSMEALVIARAVQGLGAGALVPAALAGIADLTTGPAKGRLFGIVGVLQVLGNIAGPLVGGIFTDGPGWRWGLWAVVPVAVVALGCGALGLPRPSGSGWVLSWRRLDWAQPLRLLRGHRQMQSTFVGALLLGVALMSATAYLPLLAQGVFGRSATGSSAVLIPLMAGVGVGSMVGGYLASRRAKRGLIAGWGAATLAFVALGVITATSGTLPLAGIASAVAGAGIGTVQPILLINAQDTAALDATAAASAMVQLGRNLGGAIGTSMLGLLVVGPSLATGLTVVFGCLAGTAALGVAINALTTRAA